MSLYEKYAAEVDTFVGVCGKLARNQYVAGHGGNLAWKVEDDLIIITPTCMYKGDITAEEVVFINMAGETVEGKNRPTGEKPIYINFFNSRPDCNAVLHCHPPHAGAFAINKGENLLNLPVYPETTTECGPVPLVPYGLPLSLELADNFTPYLQKFNAFMMENHGLIVMTPRDIEWAFFLTEVIELTAVSLLAAAPLGGIKKFTDEQLRELDDIMTTRNLPMYGAPGVNKSLVDVYGAAAQL